MKKLHVFSYLLASEFVHATRCCHKKWQHNIINNKQFKPMNHLLYKSLTTAVIITIVFLALSHFDVYLEETHAITGYRKNFLKAPVQFALIFVVSMTVMHLFSNWFHVKQ